MAKDVFLFQGLLARNVSIASRGADDALWSDEGGVFCSLNNGARFGTDVFISDSGWYMDSVGLDAAFI